MGLHLSYYRKQVALIALIGGSICEHLVLYMKQLCSKTKFENIADMPTDHKAVFWGEELEVDETLTPRFIGAVVTSPNSYGLYNADEADQVGIDTLQVAIDFYEGKVEEWLSVQVFWNSQIGSLGPFAVQKCLDAGKIKDAFNAGLEWLNNLNTTWKSLIGASATELERVGCKCSYYDYGIYQGSQNYYGIEDCQNLEDDDIVCNPLYELVSTSNPSDGFILAESAMNGPGMNYPPEFMDGSNHMRMKNDSNMKDAVDKIFIFGLDGPYFGTDER